MSEKNMYLNNHFFLSLVPEKTYRFRVLVYDSKKLLTKSTFSCKGSCVTPLITSLLPASFPSSFEIFVYHRSLRRFLFFSLPTSNLIYHYFK